MHPDGLIAKRDRTPLLVAVAGEKSLAMATAAAGDGIMCVGVIPDGARGVTYLTFGTVLDEDFASPRVLDAIGPIAVVYHGTYEAAGAGVDALPGGAGWREEVERFPEAVRHLYVHEGLLRGHPARPTTHEPRARRHHLHRHTGAAARASRRARGSGRGRDRLRAPRLRRAPRAARHGGGPPRARSPASLLRVGQRELACAV